MDAKHHFSTKDLIWYGVTAISISVGIILVVQNFYLSRDADEQKHRADVNDAYFIKALIDRSKLRDAGYLAERRANELKIEHCKSHPCNFPPEMNIMLTEVIVEPMDKILSDKKKANYDKQQ